MRFGFIRLHYLLLYTVVGAYLPYASLYLAWRGLSEAAIGWVVGVYGLAVMAMPAVMAHLADRRIANRTLIGVGYSVTAVALAGLWASESFGALLLWSLVFSVAYTPTFSLLDGLNFAAMHDTTDAGGKPPAYHRTRLWGSFGFMLPSAALLLILWGTADVRPAILLACGCALAAALTSIGLPLPRRRNDPDKPSAMPSAEAWRALRRKPVGTFVAAMLGLFLAISIFYGFFSLYLKELGVDAKWVGVILNIGVAVEIVVIIFSGRLLRAIGLRGVLILGAVSMTARMALLALFPIPAVAIAAQVLHGPTVLAIYILPPLYLNHKAAPAFRNSMQGVYGALCFGVARVVGSIIGGHVAEYGLRQAFGVATGLSAIATFALIARFRDDEACKAIEASVGPGDAEPSKPNPAEPQLPDP